MNPTRTTSVSTARFGYEFFRALQELRTWLDKHRLTLEDAERTMQRACALHRAHGARPQEIVRYFIEVHGIPWDESHMVSMLAAFFAFDRRLQRLQGGRFGADYPKRTVTFLVTVDEDDYEMVAPFMHRGTPVFESGG